MNLNVVINHFQISSFIAWTGLGLNRHEKQEKKFARVKKNANKTMIFTLQTLYRLLIIERLSQSYQLTMNHAVSSGFRSHAKLIICLYFVKFKRKIQFKRNVTQANKNRFAPICFDVLWKKGFEQENVQFAFNSHRRMEGLAAFVVAKCDVCV